MEQDTIVMGSDGLFDNMFDHEIVSVVTRHGDVSETGSFLLIHVGKSRESLAFWLWLEILVVLLAKALCDLANQHSTDPSFDSPYSVEARARVGDKTIPSHQNFPAKFIRQLQVVFHLVVWCSIVSSAGFWRSSVEENSGNEANRHEWLKIFIVVTIIFLFLMRDYHRFGPFFFFRWKTRWHHCNRQSSCQNTIMACEAQRWGLKNFLEFHLIHDQIRGLVVIVQPRKFLPMAHPIHTDHVNLKVANYYKDEI